MSLSNPTASTSPVTKYIEWKGGEGVFSYWDKEQENRVNMPERFYIIVLDQLNTVRGYHEESESGIFANEVHNLSKQELTVKSHKGGVIAQGLWNDIKDKVTAKGGKYTKAVYAALIVPKPDKTFSVECVKLDIYGSSVSPWIDAKIYDDGSVIELSKNPEAQKKGKTVFYQPFIVKKEKRLDVLDRCIAMDKELQQYLSNRESDTVAEVAVSTLQVPTATKAQSDNETDDLPF